MGDDDNNVVSLGKAKADKTQDSRQWTALDALKDMLEGFEAGKYDPATKIYIAMQEPHKDGVSYPYSTAGMTKMEVSGLLAIHLARSSAENI